jgi:hypothetical protein
MTPTPNSQNLKFETCSLLVWPTSLASFNSFRCMFLLAWRYREALGRGYIGCQMQLARVPCTESGEE